MTCFYYGVDLDPTGSGLAESGIEDTEDIYTCQSQCKNKSGCKYFVFNHASGATDVRIVNIQVFFYIYITLTFIDWKFRIANTLILLEVVT